MLSRRGLLAAGGRFRCTRALLFDGGGGSESGLPAEVGKRLTQTFFKKRKRTCRGEKRFTDGQRRKGPAGATQSKKALSALTLRAFISMAFTLLAFGCGGRICYSETTCEAKLTKVYNLTTFGFACPQSISTLTKVATRDWIRCRSSTYPLNTPSCTQRMTNNTRTPII